MKNIILLCLIAFCFYASSCTENKGAAMDTNAIIQFPDTVNLGDVSVLDTIRGEINITNKGKAPLLLKKVTASCQCTTPVYDSLPVQSNASTKIHVGIYLKDTGYFEKNIVFEANTDSIYQVVVLKGRAIK